MSPKESVNWKRFYNSFFGDPYWAWHDGLDIDALHSLLPEEKEKAKELFLERMNENDTRAAVGLGELRSKEAVPRLRELLNKATGRELVDIAVALAKIEGDKSYAKYIIHVLKNNPWWYNRIWAAIHLREFDFPEVVESLFEAVKDPDYLVRNHACDSLLQLHGFEPNIANYEEIFVNIISPHKGEPAEEDYKKYETAVKQLRKMFKEKKNLE
ncbi:MAG: HEAT repeat domain-containing protein [Candidatus Jordarchaeum sp.]|uniref:HEAT repeat domain-containing protein n=1 Tax=Candidatus Jordarchaeum sp. TaxID=2823881 RepID=UPI00404B3855